MVKRFIKVIVLLLLTWGASFYWFCNTLPQPLPQHSPCEECKTDAIVVLTGAQGRIAYGLTLLNQNIAETLLIAGVNPGTSKYALLKASGYRGSIDSNKIILESISKTTQENAQEVNQWALKAGVKHIRLVTSTYHMPRALFEFATWAPSLKVTPDPINPLDPVRQAWCKDYKVFCLYLNEYHKFLGAFVRQTIKRIYIKAQLL